jgi:hypothetical protein
MFVGLHAMLARATDTPEIELTPDEGAAFMGAAQNVLRHYSVAATQKTLDWIAFAGVTSGIYGPRMFAIHMRRKAGQEPRRPAAGPGPTIAPDTEYRVAA